MATAKYESIGELVHYSRDYGALAVNELKIERGQQVVLMTKRNRR
ncbi:MAG: hypothetical protein WB778_00450 [Thermoplasmata archaeon]